MNAIYRSLMPKVREHLTPDLQMKCSICENPITDNPNDLTLPTVHDSCLENHYDDYNTYDDDSCIHCGDELDEGNDFYCPTHAKSSKLAAGVVNQIKNLSNSQTNKSLKRRTKSTI